MMSQQRLAGFIAGLPKLLASGEALDLVIAGDFIDFLAVAPWSPWTPDPEGVLAKRVLDSSLDKVNDVLLEQSLAGRLLGYGNLQILTASEQGINRLDTIPRPLAFKRAMLAAKSGPGKGGAAVAGPAARLEELEELRRRGLVSAEEYRAKRAAILERL